MTKPAEWRRAVVAGLLHRVGAKSVGQCLDRVAGVLDSAAVAALMEQFDEVEPTPQPRPDELMPVSDRRGRGAYFTPTPLADEVAALALDRTTTGRVLDLSCGDGGLLAACARRGDVQLLGVELELVFALAAAVRLVDHDARIFWGDGLELRDELRECSAIVGNPPYVGEKGHRDLFDEVRGAHQDLRRYFAPRMDLHYLFIHRALDYLADGGRLAYLTSEYWLTATGAGLLRADLARRTTDRRFERLGDGAFASAPGQHSLLFSAVRRKEDAPGDEATWHPFATTPVASSGVALGDVCLDRQGFVSGADRTTSSHAAKFGVHRDEPVFVWHASEVPSEDADLFRPLVRRSDCTPNEILAESPANDFVLWCDGSEDESTQVRIDRYLKPYRAILSARREVTRGRMCWSRIWWPRRTIEYARPKLVVPRRAKTPRFCLDLSGSYVSSDCTFILAPEDVTEPIEWLIRIMVAANSERAEQQIREYGKTKGEIIEFYSTPLRAWRLPLRRVGTSLRIADPELEARATALCGEVVSER